MLLSYHLIQSSIAVEAWHKEPHGVLINRDVLEDDANFVEYLQQEAAFALASCLAGSQAIGGQLLQKHVIMVVVLAIQELGKCVKRIAILPAMVIRTRQFFKVGQKP